MTIDNLTISAEVSAALAGGRPTVALETTLVSHGFPPGRGAQVALEAEAAVRAGQAVPASVGVLESTIRVGLSEEELARFSARPETRKLGSRDLALCLAAGEMGATTVGATLAVCGLAEISVFATGGIGGVHRGYTERPDVSSDLAQLARTQAVVVCSGVKSLLDVDATHEALESLGIPVLGWRADTLPLFYSRDGGPGVERVETAALVARVARRHWELGGQGLLLVRPPDPEIPSVKMELLFDRALAEAERAEVRGGAVTPFVLAHAHEASGGRTLDVNHRLIVDNAALAAEIAVELAGGQTERGQA